MYIILKQRILSALVAIPPVIAAVYLGGAWFGLLLLAAVNAAMWEYLGSLKARGFTLPAFWGYLGASLLLFLAYSQKIEYFIPLLTILFILLFALLVTNFPQVKIWELALLLWGIIYLGLFAGYILALRLLPGGLVYTLLLLAGVWVNDSFAYFIGIKWGRHKLAPHVSPKKSVEGALGSVAGSLLVFLGAVLLFPRQVNLEIWQAAVLALGVSFFAGLGDLLESAFKRQVEVKDSGRLIPGHGGLLDRLDSLLLVAPFMYYFFLLVN